MVTVPPLSGVLTTVSFFSPQPQTVAGKTEESSSDAQAAMTTAKQRSFRVLADFILLLSYISKRMAINSYLQLRAASSPAT